MAEIACPSTAYGAVVPVTNLLCPDYNFSNITKNVVHMTVKPQEIVDEEEANKKVKESGASSRGSGCCVIL